MNFCRGLISKSSLTLCLWLFVSMTVPVWGNNHHEHMTTLYRVTDLMPVISKVMDLPVVKLILPERDLQGVQLGVRQLLEKLCGLNLAKASALAGSIDEKTTLKEILKWFADGGSLASEFDGLVTLMMFRPGFHDRRGVSPIWAYLVLTQFRSALFEQLSVSDLEKVTRHYFEHESFVDTKVIDVTAAHSLRSKEFIQMFRMVASDYHVETKFFYSIPRKAFMQNLGYGEGYLREVASRIRKLAKMGLIQGIDIVGSLNETRLKLINGVSVEECRDRLLRIMKLASELNLELRIHCFEQTNQGHFYQALKLALQQFEGPLFLRVGHIGALMKGRRSEWLETLHYFYQHQKRAYPEIKDPVVFEATVASGMILHGRSQAKYRSTITAIQNLGMKVVSGADGRGVFGFDSTFSRQQLLLFQVGAPIRAVAAEPSGFDTLHTSGNAACRDALLAG